MPETEQALIDWIAAEAGTRSRFGVVRGIGDDCAIFRPRMGEDLVFTTDQLIAGVHFTTDWTPRRVGERALARSLSDISAMGADPRFCLVSLALTRSGAMIEDRVKLAKGEAPPKTSRAATTWAKSFFRGLIGLARETGVVLAGGDLASDDKIHCDVMICGSVPQGKALRRDGAQPGNLLYVSGTLGKPWDRRLEPRMELGRKLRGKATACIDISDGLVLDLHRLCRASGVSAQLDHIPITRKATIEEALYGGEDYELLFTMPPGRPAPSGVTQIGSITRGISGEVIYEGNSLQPRGFDHFA